MRAFVFDITVTVLVEAEGEEHVSAAIQEGVWASVRFRPGSSARVVGSQVVAHEGSAIAAATLL